MSVLRGSVRYVDDAAQTRQIAIAYVDSLEQRDWPRLTTLLAEDVVYEMPQTRERIRGRSAFLQFNMEYPGDWHLRVRRVVADGRLAALWLDVRVGAEEQDACVWVEAGEHGLIDRITDYWPEPYDPPTGREHLVERGRSWSTPWPSASPARSSSDLGFGLHHVQLAMPPGAEEACREFYVDKLGMTEVRKPPVLAARGGLWVRADKLEIHLGVEEEFRPARKAHPGILVADLDGLAKRLAANGVQVTWDDNFPGHRRCYAHDNLGNRLEFLTPHA